MVVVIGDPSREKSLQRAVAILLVSFSLIYTMMSILRGGAYEMRNEMVRRFSGRK